MKKLYQVLMGRSIRAVYFYRISAWMYNNKLKPIAQIFWSLNVALHAIEISPTAKIGKNFKLAHTVGTVIGNGVTIGDNVTIYQNVTLGSKKIDDKTESYPVVEDGVIIYPGSIIIGDMTVGENSIIGANSVVLKDIPNNVTAAGSPARIIKSQEQTSR